MERYGDLFDSFIIVFTKSDENLFNRGLAINRGVMESKTPYFAAFDVDCITEKRMLTWQLIY